MPMLKQVALGVVALVAFVAPARADLHYTTRTEARPVAPPAGANPVLAMSTEMVVKMLLPDGVAETTYWVSAQGTRIELANATVMFPAGAVILRLVNDLPVVLNPRDHTYWRFAIPAMLSSPPTLTPEMQAILTQMKPEVSVTRTDDRAVIAGVETEGVIVKSTVTLPLPAGMPLPPGMSSTVTTTAALWIAHQFDAYAASAMPMPALMGISGVPPQGFVMKAIGHASSMTAVEFETVVTRIAEEPAPSDAFAIPADYKEIPAPTPGI
jgi:hypothetical protein